MVITNDLARVAGRCKRLFPGVLNYMFDLLVRLANRLATNPVGVQDVMHESRETFDRQEARNVTHDTH